MMAFIIATLTAVCWFAVPSSALIAPTIVLDEKCDQQNRVCDVSDNLFYLFNCSGDDSTTVYWVLGDYQTADPNEFLSDGIFFNTEPAPDTLGIQNSFRSVQLNLTMAPNGNFGMSRLFEFFNVSNFNISCIALKNAINIVGRESVLIREQGVVATFDEVTGPTVVEHTCTSGGTVRVDFTYERASGNDSCEGVYLLSMTGSNNTCSKVAVAGTRLSASCIISDASSVVNATLICGHMSRVYPLNNISCCMGGCGRNGLDFTCSCEDGWSCTNITNGTATTVVSMFNRQMLLGLTSPATSPCAIIPQEGGGGEAEEEDGDPLAISLVVVFCFIFGLVIGLVIPLVIYCVCSNK